MFILGIYGGFFGGGFGTLMIFILISVYGFSFITSVATTNTGANAMNIMASLTYITLGIVDYSILIPLMIVMAIGGYIGSRVAIKIGNIWIKRMYVSLAIIMAVKLLMG